jgi:hypothetical protein
MTKLVEFINEMERAVLSKDSGLTSVESIQKSSDKEVRGYYRWLCQQTPSWFHPDFDSFDK